MEDEHLNQELNRIRTRLNECEDKLSHISGNHAPEFPWHLHTGSKCPVPKRRRGEVIELSGLCWCETRPADDVEWDCVSRWRYTQPDPKPRKWGPWSDDIKAFNSFCGISQSEQDGVTVLRYRVKL